MEVSKLVAVVSIVLLVAAVPVFSAASDAEVEDGIVQGDADIRDASVSVGSVTVGDYMITFSPTIGISYEILDRDGDSVSFKVVGEQGVSINPSTVKVAVGDDILQPEGGIYTLNGITSDIMVSIDGEPYYSSYPGDAPDVSPFPTWIVFMILAIVFAVAAVLVWMRGRNVGSGE